MLPVNELPTILVAATIDLYVAISAFGVNTACACMALKDKTLNIKILAFACIIIILCVNLLPSCCSTSKTFCD